MSNPQNIFGPAPKDPLESGKNAPSPEKFKKVMGVEHSDESQERGQKNRLRQADEEEGEENESIKTDSDLFSRLMSDKQTKQINLGPTRQVNQQASQPTEDLDLAGSTDTFNPSKDQDKIQLFSNQKITPQDQNDFANEDFQKPIQQKEKTDPFLELEKIEEKMEGLVHTHPKPSTSTKGQKEKAELEFHLPHAQHKHKAHKESDISKILPQPTPPLLNKQEELEKQTVDTLATPLLTQVGETTPSSPLTPAPAYAQFPPHFYELFQKLVGVMTVMQFQGKTTTSIVLNIPNTSLHGAHIDIEHFDTAPHAFNIQIFSNPDGQKIFSNNLQTLEQQLKNNLPQFEINVKKPLLLDETKEDRRRRLSQVQKQQGKN